MSKVKLNELCSYFKGLSVPRDRTSVSGEIPYLHYGDLYKKYDFRVDLDKVRSRIIKISSSEKIKNEQYLVDGDIVFALTSETIEDLGHCTLIINKTEESFVSGMETTVIHIKDKERVNGAFLNYIFQSDRFRLQLRQYVKGMKVFRVDPSDLLEIEIELPSMNEQEKIVSVLNSISDKIDTNCRINDYLSSILQQQYQELLKNNNNDSTLSDICKISNDRIFVSELSNLNYFSAENMLPNKGGVVDASTLPDVKKVTRCKPGDTIISNIRPYFKKIHYCSNMSGCSADVLCFSPNTFELAPLLYSILYSDEFFDYVTLGSKGTKMPRGDKKQIMDYPIGVSINKDLSDFLHTGTIILDAIQKNCEENMKLTSIRDLLLPKLISGEINTSKLELCN